MVTAADAVAATTMVGLQYAHVHTMVSAVARAARSLRLLTNASSQTSPRPLGPPPGPTTTTTTTAHPPTSPQPARRRLSARRAPSASSLLDDERDPYPASMPRPVLSRAGSSSAGGTGGGGTGTAAGMSPVASLPRDELHRLELLINSYEAEEEAIMHRLARRLEELRRHEVAMSAQMEQESEGMVNRLQRQLRVVQGQLEAARRRGEGTVGEAGNGQGGMPLGTSPVPNGEHGVGRQPYNYPLAHPSRSWANSGTAGLSLWLGPGADGKCRRVAKGGEVGSRGIPS